MNKITGVIFDLAQRAGKWGIPGVVLLCMRSVIDVVRGPSWNSIESAITTIGVGMILVGVLANTKKLKDITVAVAAEASVARTEIANATPGPCIPLPVSTVSAVNREVAKQVTGTAMKVPE